MVRYDKLPVLIGALALAWGCAAPMRFADREILWQDPDNMPIPQPRPREAGIQWTGMRDALFLPADRFFSLDYGEEAGNVNALDEVPDSAWFQDPRRDPAAGTARPRALRPEEMTLAGAPLPQPPFTIVSGKTIGATPGFVVVDAHKTRYLVKTDMLGWRGLSTSTEAVAARLAWAFGWLVPEEVLIDLRSSDLRLAPNAHSKDQWGHEQPFTAADLDRLLQRTPRGQDGTILALMSRWIKGRNIGSFAWFGRRGDDPNDRVPHENRRDLRGFGVFSAWVNNIDTMENNTMDMYAGPPGQGHVVHYQQDVGGSFGLFAAQPMEYWMSRQTFFSIGGFFKNMAGFGFQKFAWEDDEALRQRRQYLLKTWPELGFFDDVDFDPRHWQPVLDNPAFVRQTRRDRYWGAKRVIAISAAELRAAISVGHYRPEAAERLFQVLWSRRHRIAAAFLGDVAPLDYFRFESGKLCFDDLWIAAGLGGERGTEYAVREQGVPGRLPWGPAAAPDSGPDSGAVRCVPLEARPGYRVIELAARRPGADRFGPAVRVHLITAGRPRVLGIER